MASLSSFIFYILSFLALYVQVFFLVTFLENRKKITIRKGKVKLQNYPPVTIIVPCWNEETTIDKTVKSILDLNYPKDKLQVFLIDDGSTDNTWQALQKYQNTPNFKIFQKENGGKHTALNFGLERLETPYIGCLDADSVADPDAVNRIMSYFENDHTLMAVAPSIIVVNDKKIIQNAQSAEYYMAVYIKKMLGFLGGIHVTPGPLTIFKKKVFDDLGPYRHAHNTEDMEIAYRMQINGYKIEQCNDAFVYTNTPNSVYKLYKQRLRWIYGFINNTIDYKNFLFKSKYGTFSLFTVPAGIVSIFAATYLFFRLVFNISQFIYNKFIEYSVVGFEFTTDKGFHFDTFFLNTKAFIFITIILYALVITSMLLGSRIAKDKWSLSVNMFYFFFIYSVIAPFWLLRAVFNTLISKKPSWR
jgi:cellulose synthase/poly-beta-1,6-N-acetylglucosamine synthase-like glycosyltransferase